MNDDAEFFIGWQGRAPPRTGRKLLRAAMALAAAVVAGAVGFAALQRTIGAARWDYGVEREFTGVMLVDPVPMLLADVPEAKSGAQLFLLVRPDKHGFDSAEARRHEGKRVRLRATLLYREGRAMLDVVPQSVEETEPGTWKSALPPVVDLGDHVLRGEIVDGKCYLGAMNPGVLKPHRACAILCISGGIPPVLLVRDDAGRSILYVLAGPHGESVTTGVLDFIAEPVEIRGRVQRVGEQLVLRIDPGAIERLP